MRALAQCEGLDADVVCHVRLYPSGDHEQGTARLLGTQTWPMMGGRSGHGEAPRFLGFGMSITLLRRMRLEDTVLDVFVWPSLEGSQSRALTNASWYDLWICIRRVVVCQLVGLLTDTWSHETLLVERVKPVSALERATTGRSFGRALTCSCLVEGQNIGCLCQVFLLLSIIVVRATISCLSARRFRTCGILDEC